MITAEEMNASSDYDTGSISGATEATAIFAEEGEGAAGAGGGGLNNATSLCVEYFIKPHPDPDLAECTSMVCQGDLEVRSVNVARYVYTVHCTLYLNISFSCSSVLERNKCLSLTS